MSTHCFLCVFTLQRQSTAAEQFSCFFFVKIECVSRVEAPVTDGRYLDDDPNERRGCPAFGPQRINSSGGFRSS